MIKVKKYTKQNKKYIFVYGSLKKGHYNHRLLENSKLIQNYELKDYALYSLGFFPAIKKQKGATVKGEIYEVDNETKYVIDRMELGAGYKIEKLKLNNKTIEFYVYNDTLFEHDRIKSE